MLRPMRLLCAAFYEFYDGKMSSLVFADGPKVDEACFTHLFLGNVGRSRSELKLRNVYSC